MKYLKIIIFAIVANNALGQEIKNESLIPGFKNFKIGFIVSPDINFRTLKKTDGSSSVNTILKSRNENETIKFGYTAGLNACFILNSILSIQTGVHYSTKGYQTKMTQLIYERPNSSDPIKFKSVYHFQYIDVPVKVNVAFGEKKLRLFTSLGLTANILLDEKQEMILEYSNGKTKKISQPANDNYNKLNISPAISLGLDYQLSLRTNLQIEPAFRYGIIKIIDGPAVAEYLWNAGLNISYFIRISK